MREGCKRQNTKSDSRRPITHKLLCQLVSILPSVCKSEFEAILFKAAFLVAFFGFLRVGEFSSLSKTADTSRLISRADICFKDNGMELIVRYSKTDQRGNSIPLFFHRAVTTPQFCPVQAMSEYLTIRNPVDGPLFIHFNNSPLTVHQFSFILREGVKVSIILYFT